MNMLEEGPNQPKIAQKRIKLQEIMENEEEDRISALSDCLLLEILARLRSTKDAIRTGTLSKRWACVWTLVPTLIFTHSDHPKCRCLKNPNSRSDFALLVEKTLTQCRQLKLKQFILQTHYDIRFVSQFNNWIRHSISCNVEVLDLEFMYTGTEADQFQLDQSIFIHTYFTHLRLVGCRLNPNGAIGWKNLRNLCISHVNLDEDLILNILSGSPLLETLVLEDYVGYRGHCSLDDYSDDDSESEIIEINAPNSLSLTQCPQLNLKKLKVL